MNKSYEELSEKPNTGVSIGDHDHGHGHGHEHNLSKPSAADEDECCSGGDCCGGNKADTGVSIGDHDHDHGHGHGHVHGQEHALAIATSCPHGMTGPDPCATCSLAVAVPISSPTLHPCPTVPHAPEIQASSAVEAMHLVCAACSASDTAVPHNVQVTRIRISNLCCAMEERLILSTLQGRKGIENVAVNVVGKYAVVKHCNVACCAPIDKIIELLNAERLGAAVQEAGSIGDDIAGAEDHAVWTQLAYASLLMALFFCGVAIQEQLGHDSLASVGVFIADTILGSLPILHAAFVSAFLRRTLDIHVLILVAVAGALASKEFLDAALIVSLFSAAEALEQVVLGWVRKAVASTTASVPRNCFLADGRSVPVAEVKVGHVLAVRAGDMVLADGVISKGEGSVDESALTGEAVPVFKRRGDVISSGGVVTNGYLEVTVSAEAEESTLARLQQAVMDVQADKGASARLVDLFSLYWTPTTLLFTLLFVTIGGGVSGDWHHYTNEGIVLLVLACPCSIVIATPIPSICTIAVAAKNGVLIRGSSVVERLGSVRAVAVDKTGTLTTGFFAVQDKISLRISTPNGATKLATAAQKQEQGQEQEQGRVDDDDDGLADAIACAAALEEKSSHPLAAAIISAHVGCVGEFNAAKTVGPAVRKVKVVEGVGLSGWVATDENQTDWRFVVVGNEQMVQHGLAKPLESELQSKLLESFKARHPTACVVLVAVDDELRAVAALSDSIRPDAAAFVSALRLTETRNRSSTTSTSSSIPSAGCLPVAHCLAEYMGLRRHVDVTMLTGDAKQVAEFVCREVGIDADQCFSRLLPQGKLDWVAARQSGISPRTINATANQPNPSAATSVESDAEAGLGLVVRNPQGPQNEERIWPFSRPVAVLMLGDGINDAAALAAASVGCAMGSGGSAMAVSAADVVLLSNSLVRLPAALELSRLSRTVMIFNCIFSIGLKLVAVALALAGELSLWAAILVDVGTLVVVVLVGLLPIVIPMKWDGV